MSAPQWRPGDVALVKCSDGIWRRAQYRAHSGYDPCWAFPDGLFRRAAESEVSALVVIDPEGIPGMHINAAALGSLLAASAEIVADSEPGRSLQEVTLLNFLADEFDAVVAPPKPDEPQGLGAVVVDSAGVHWVRVGDPKFPWQGNYDDEGYENLTYSDIDAVKVLSEGWSE